MLSLLKAGVLIEMQKYCFYLDWQKLHREISVKTVYKA